MTTNGKMTASDDSRSIPRALRDGTLRWRGTAGSVWDINTTTNWQVTIDLSLMQPPPPAKSGN